MTANQFLESDNLIFLIGDKTELWNKIMTEVEAGRYDGPFDSPPFKSYKQSPVGLVPKDKGTKTRLIFHLSHLHSDPKRSVNGGTPKEKCSVKYPSFNDAIIRCLEEGLYCKAGKSDLTAAFRQAPIRKEDWSLLVLKAESAIDGKVYYFVDKCLPFGHSLSCAIFQSISNGISHIVTSKMGKINVNYFDDFLFIDLNELYCNYQLHAFLEVCKDICFPVSDGKTCWATDRLGFLGLLIDMVLRLVCLPVDKIQSARQLIEKLLKTKSKKVTLLQLQQVCGHLNFFCQAIVPERPFMRRLYYATKGLTKPHHHTCLTRNLRLDLLMWLEFLHSSSVFSRPFFDFNSEIYTTQVDWYTDASKNHKLGAGGICQDNWFALQWETDFMENCDPSIEFLELYAVVVSVAMWAHKFTNQRIVLFCDNMSVVYMINKNTTHCPHCLQLIRALVLESMVHNVRIFAKHVTSKNNRMADLLSRRKFEIFWREVHKGMEKAMTPIPDKYWPMEKLWRYK